MRMVFISKRKQRQYEELIDKLVCLSFQNLEFELGEKAIDLMYDLCGMEGLLYVYGKYMSEKRVEESKLKILNDLMEDK